MTSSGSGFSLGGTNTSSPSVTTQASGFGGFSLSSLNTTSTPSGFSLTSTAPSTSTNIPTLNFSANPSVSSTSVTTTTSPGTFNLTLPTSNTGKTLFNLGSSTSSISAKPTTSATTTSVSIAASTTETSDKPINYVQLNDLTHKWKADFGDLQKMLINQTREIINRDVILSSNHDKIEKFVNSIQDLKSEQTQVEQQLDFILSQQKDLEECLSSMEEEVSSYFPDLPADDMFKLAENIDSRLKKTLETSKDIITKINDKNRSSENITNPMVAIGRILNHHTNSIHMLENSTTEAQTKLNDLLKLYQQYA